MDTRIRWRLNDPAEESRERWSKVHVLVNVEGLELSICGVGVPSYAYMEDRDEQIPSGAPMCRRCARVSGAADGQ